MKFLAFWSSSMILGLAASGMDDGNGTELVSAEIWTTVVLDCPEASTTRPIWLSPENFIIGAESGNGTSLDGGKAEAECPTANPEPPDRLFSSPNGSLIVRDFGWTDRGNYRCYFRNESGSADYQEIVVQIDPDYRHHIYYFSLMYGFITAGGFLLLTLMFKLLYFILETYGCCLCCCCCENRLPPKAKKIKVALDSIESYKQQQLDKLKENYAQQSEWIRENCALQMERVRDNYNYQVQNIKDIKQYGSTQIQAVREQYFEQMHRIRDYSTGQLDRAHENYIFQRQRLRKFSAQNYLRMRATGKYTQRTLNKVMENLPPLYLDLSNCRQGMGGRQESINFPADFQIEELQPFDCFQHDETDARGSFQGQKYIDEDNSVYFTPEDTPLKEVNPKAVARNKSSSLKNTPTREANPYKAVYKKHKRSKSLSNFLPQKWLYNGSAKSESSEVNVVPDLQQQTVQVIVERATTSQDYLDKVDVGHAVSENDVKLQIEPDDSHEDIINYEKEEMDEKQSAFNDEHSLKDQLEHNFCDENDYEKKEKEIVIEADPQV